MPLFHCSSGYHQPIHRGPSLAQLELNLVILELVKTPLLHTPYIILLLRVVYVKSGAQDIFYLTVYDFAS